MNYTITLTDTEAEAVRIALSFAMEAWKEHNSPAVAATADEMARAQVAITSQCCEQYLGRGK